MDDDETLLARAESALTEIKVAQGLSEEHASLLAALRIRLKGKADASLDELLESAGDIGGPSDQERDRGPSPRPKPSLDEAIARPEVRRSLDDVLGEHKEPKPDWPG